MARICSIKHCQLTYSGFSFLSFPRTTSFSNFSRYFPSESTSLRRSSSLMMSKSRTGLTSPSTCVTSGSSNAPGKWNWTQFKGNVLGVCWFDETAKSVLSYFHRSLFSDSQRKLREEFKQKWKWRKFMIHILRSLSPLTRVIARNWR